MTDNAESPIQRHQRAVSEEEQLEADNIVLISIVEENIEVMQCSLSLFSPAL